MGGGGEGEREGRGREKGGRGEGEREGKGEGEGRRGGREGERGMRKPPAWRGQHNRYLEDDQPYIARCTSLQQPFNIANQSWDLAQQIHKAPHNFYSYSSNHT